MTIREALNHSIKRLSKKSSSPILDSEVLLAYVFKKSREYLFKNPQKNLRKYLRKFSKLIDRRTNGWPVAYLVNEKEFYGLKFYVDKNVLIPRPETEGIVDLVLSQISKLKSPISILDIGTGSGNIIIALAKALYNLQPKTYNLLFASDVSTKALAIAQKNAKKHKAKIKFEDGHLLEPWGKRNFDVIVANLPYLAKQTHSSTKFEPKRALIASKKGLALYEQLFKQIARRNNSPQPPLNLRGGGRRPGALLPSLIFLEIGRDQSQKIKKLADKLLPASPAGGPAFETKIYKDLSGFDRFVLLQPKTYHL